MIYWSLQDSPDDDEYFQPFTQVIPLIQKYLSNGNSITTDTTYSASIFLPRDRAGYYRYEGSLTTPTCDEGVIWTIFTQTLPISQNQVSVLSKIPSLLFLLTSCLYTDSSISKNLDRTQRPIDVKLP